MIYEYRVYEAAPGKLEALNARFSKTTLSAFFETTRNQEHRILDVRGR